MRTKHVMIFVSRYIEEGTHRVSVIEASDSAGKVIKRPGWYYDKDGVYRYFSAYKDPYYHSDSDIADCFPYYFIDDHTPPNINVSGVVNGGIYNKKPVILSYSITDDVDIYPYVKILLTCDGVKVIDKEYNKYENQKAKPIEETKELTQDGKYELKITAEDWENWGTKGNNVLLHFIIDATPPKIGLKQPPKIIWVPQSEWPNGSYKVPISYPVNISCDVKDNFAVNGVRVYLDDRLIYTQSNISTTTYQASLDVSISAGCGWSRHTLKITATDLAGNMSGLI